MEFTGPKHHIVNINRTERYVSVVLGSALAMLGLQRRSRAGLLLAGLGGVMIQRGSTGHCYLFQFLGVRTAPKGQGAETTSVPYELGIRVDRGITVDRPRAEVFRFWRNLENLPRFTKHLVSVTRIDDKRSHWVAKGPAGSTVEWDASIINEAQDERIAWRSLEGAEVQSAGAVVFRDAPGGRGTEISVHLQYNPPAGTLGATVAKLLGEEPHKQIAEDLLRFRQLMEDGVARQHDDDIVDEMSKESFPASDSPAYY